MDFKKQYPIYRKLYQGIQILFLSIIYYLTYVYRDHSLAIEYNSLIKIENLKKNQNTVCSMTTNSQPINISFIGKPNSGKSSPLTIALYTLDLPSTSSDFTVRISCNVYDAP